MKRRTRARKRIEEKNNKEWRTEFALKHVLGLVGLCCFHAECFFFGGGVGRGYGSGSGEKEKKK